MGRMHDQEDGMASKERPDGQYRNSQKVAPIRRPFRVHYRLQRRADRDRMRDAIQVNYSQYILGAGLDFVTVLQSRVLWKCGP